MIGNEALDDRNWYRMTGTDGMNDRNWYRMTETDLLDDRNRHRMNGVDDLLEYDRAPIDRSVRSAVDKRLNTETLVDTGAGAAKPL